MSWARTQHSASATLIARSNLLKFALTHIITDGMLGEFNSSCCYCCCFFFFFFLGGGGWEGLWQVYFISLHLILIKIAVSKYER